MTFYERGDATAGPASSIAPQPNPWARLTTPPPPTVADTDPPSVLWWMGAHGGAGETTLSALIPHTRAAGHAWPTGPVDVVLVARTSVTGLRAAQHHAGQHAKGHVPGVRLHGLVLIADAPGRLPRPLRDYRALVAGGTSRTWHLDWIEDLRVLEDPTQLTGRPRSLTQLGEDIRVLTVASPIPKENRP